MINGHVELVQKIKISSTYSTVKVQTHDMNLIRELRKSHNVLVNIAYIQCTGCSVMKQESWYF